jgi:uncharacterized protein YbjT (DUF2867 family)
VNAKSIRTTLLTGATGYIGSRLASRLLKEGYRIRCVVRCAEKARARSWANDERVELIELDLHDVDALAEAMKGCCAAYYLVHSMMIGSTYRENDMGLASCFSAAATKAGLPRIIYLGGLGETGTDLSEHLSSRREVENSLAAGTAELTVLRAAMIIGSGSASFEILRNLVERLPVMITPRWVCTQSQPIAIGDVLRYLVDVLNTPETVGKAIDIGGRDVRTYEELMQVMAMALGLRRRLIIRVPVLTPRLSSLWIHLVTPVSSRIARPLAEGLRNRVVCRNDLAQQLMPGPLHGVKEAIELAVEHSTDPPLASSCFDAGKIPGDPNWAGGTVLMDQRSMIVQASPEATFQAVDRIGGHNGYYAYNWLWKLRAWMDVLAGGCGLRRGRRDPVHLAVGDAVDFWRVSMHTPGVKLGLRAEMRLPGKAELDFQVSRIPGDNSCCELTQTARFRPSGILGIAYWYSVKPFHALVFGGMISGIATTAVTSE